jgi:hypothetical protein
MARVESNKQKNNPNIPSKVDLVYYFAIHKEDESKENGIVYKLFHQELGPH